MKEISLKSKIIVFISTIVIILSIMFVTKEENNSFSTVQNIIAKVYNPALKGFSFAGDKFMDLFSTIFASEKLKNENEALKLENNELKKNIAIYENLISNAKFLEEEKNLIANTKYKLKPSYVIAKDPSSYFLSFTIDKGKKDGVKAGDIVVIGKEIGNKQYIESLVGTVDTVGNSYSKVSAVINEDKGISFKTARTGAGGVLDGRVENGFSGNLFDEAADVKVGDKLLTSGTGGVFPRDIYIGDITEIIVENENIEKIIVESKVDFTNLYRVLILDKDEGDYE